jgi:hypothetical protein
MSRFESDDKVADDFDVRRIVRPLLFFGFVFGLQVGHLIEHIAKTVSGQGLLGPAADNELSHLLFNSLIAVLSVCLIRAYPMNPWVYPLALLCLFHGLEHVYIYQQYIRTGVVNGPGLLGIRGAFGIIPLERLDLHNAYNGMEVILLQLGLWYEVEGRLA